MPSIHSEYAERLFHWSLDDFHEEIDGGLRKLEFFRSARALRVLTTLRSSDPQAQRLLARALVRKRMLTFCTALADSIGALRPEEDALMSAMFDAPPWPPREQHSILQSRASRPDLFRVDPAVFVAELERTLAGDLGSLSRSNRPYEWLYTANINGWTVRTHVCPMRRDSASLLLYHHDISAPGIGYLDQHLSFLSWLGISSSTSWDHVMSSETSQIVGMLKVLSVRFLEAVPQLVPKV